jgi:hypothetical protein
MKKMRTGLGDWIVRAIGILILFAIGAAGNSAFAAPGFPSDSGGMLQEQGKTAMKKMEPLWRSVLEFRQLALRDYEKALTLYAAKPVQDKFRILDKHVWSGIDPREGWSFFMNISVFDILATESPLPLVAFYNGFSDVYLVTAWRIDQDPPQMVDAEMFPGDWIRQRGKPPFDVNALWLRQKIFLPAALGKAVAESIKALEDIFSGWTGSDWRGQIGGEQDENVRLEETYPAASIMLMRALRNIDALVAPGSEEPGMLSSLRLELALVMKQIIEGGIEKVLAAANETAPGIKPALRLIPVDTFKTMACVNATVAKDDAVAFMAPAFDADYCLSFYFAGGADELRLRRIDIIYYSGWYQELSKNRPEKGKE